MGEYLFQVSQARRAFAGRYRIGQVQCDSGQGHTVRQRIGECHLTEHDVSTRVLAKSVGIRDLLCDANRYVPVRDAGAAYQAERCRSVPAGSDSACGSGYYMGQNQRYSLGVATVSVHRSPFPSQPDDFVRGPLFDRSTQAVPFSTARHFRRPGTARSPQNRPTTTARCGSRSPAWSSPATAAAPTGTPITADAFSHRNRTVHARRVPPSAMRFGAGATVRGQPS